MSASSINSSSSERRQFMLAELDIDVWQVRGAVPVGRAVPAVPAVPALPEPAARTGLGPAAAIALLEEAMPGVPASSAAPSVPGGGPLASAVDQPPSDTAEAPPALHASGLSTQPPLDLWCLSGPQGVLLANFSGLSPLDQRLLHDVFQATCRLLVAKQAGAPAATKAATKADTKESAPNAAGKLKVTQLRFNWPPAETSADSAQAISATASKDAAPVNRALRGFLNRQLQGKNTPVILLAAQTLQERLAEIDLGVAPERTLFIGEPAQLVGDGAAKRALWATLNQL